jgi:hypothetical protein
MKTIIYIKSLSKFTRIANFFIRTEIEYYNDGTNAIVEAQYTPRNS